MLNVLKYCHIFVIVISLLILTNRYATLNIINISGTAGLWSQGGHRGGLTKTSRDAAGTPSLGPVSHQVDGLGAITVSDAGMP